MQQLDLNNKLQRNIRVLYIFSFCWLALIIIPVVVPFFASKGLSLADVFVLQSIFALSVVLCEVPSGYLADIIGRRNALVIGSLFHGLGYTLLCFAEDFAGLVVFEVTVGLGVSLLSGADLSLLYDSQVALRMGPREKTKGIANLRTINSTAEGVAALLGGALVLVSFELMLWVNAVVAWLPFLLSFALVEAPFKRMSVAQPIHNFKRIMAHLFQQDELLRLTSLALIFYGLSTFYIIWLIQPYWEAYGIPLAFFGLLWALKNFTIAIASKMSMPLENRFGPVPVLIGMALLPVMGYLGMAVPGGMLGILLAFGFYLSRGIYQVILTDAFNSRVPSEFRATANSVISFMFRLAFIATGPALGLLYEWQGMRTSLLILGIVCMLLFVVVMLPLVRALGRRAQARPDAPMDEQPTATLNPALFGLIKRKEKPATER